MPAVLQANNGSSQKQRGAQSQSNVSAPLSKNNLTKSYAKNVGSVERIVSLAAGTILGCVGLARRDFKGLGIAAIGGSLIYRGSTGHCTAYQTLGINTNDTIPKQNFVHVRQSYLINKPAETLYKFWRNFENLPQFMKHLESVRVDENGISHWVTRAPGLYGGTVAWDAEVVAEEPNSYIAWRTGPDSEVVHHGSVRFEPALGERGTNVKVELKYQPPLGNIGHWIATLFGENPEQQIHDDLRNFKRLMELGEIITIDGQSRGTCESC